MKLSHVLGKEESKVERLINQIVNETRIQERYIEACTTVEHLDQEVYNSTVTKHTTNIRRYHAAILNTVSRLDFELIATRLSLEAIRAGAQELAKI